MATDDKRFTSAPSPVYGDSDVMVRFRVLDLLWKPVGRIVRFCIVHHPVRGTIFLLSTDTSLSALKSCSCTAIDSRLSWAFARPCMSWVPMAITSGCLA